MIRKLLVAGVWVLCAVAFGAPAAQAQTTYTWNGGGANANWSTSANWTGGTPQPDANLTQIVLAGTTRLTNTVDLLPAGGLFDINSLTFASGAGAFVVNPTGSNVTTLQIKNGITSNASNTETIANPLALSGSQTWSTTSTGALTVSGTVNLNANTLSLAAASSGAITLSGVISGAGGITKVGAGSGVVSLSNAANTYTGVTTVSSGVLAASTLADGGTASSIGQSSNAATNLVLDGGTFQYTGAAVSTNRLFTVTQNGGTLDASGSGAVNFTNAGSLVFSSPSTTTFTLTGTSTAANTLTPVIGDGGGATSVVKNGTGRWVLAGANTYTGPTTVNAGTLQFNSPSAIGGSGATVTVNSGGTVAAGYAIDQAFLGRIVNTSTGSVGLGVNSGNNLDFSAAGANLSNVRLGAAAGTTVNYTGTLTPFGNTYMLGGGGTLTLPNVLANAPSGTTNVDVGNGGVVALNGANTYTGTTTISGGSVLATTNLGNGGAPSGIGNVSNAPGNLILNGGSAGATLRYTGTATTSTDRQFTLGTGTAAGSIDASGVSGNALLTNGAAITFTGGTMGFLSSGARTLTLTGTSGQVNTFQAPDPGFPTTGYSIPLSAAFNTFNTPIVDGTGGATSLTKSGTGTWLVQGANAYTGNTTVSAGTLAINRVTAGATPVGTGTVTLSGGTLSIRATSSPLTVTGFNQDVIASYNDIASPQPFGTTSSIDAGPGANNGFAFIQNRADFLSAFGIPTTVGLPAGGQFVHLNNPSTTFQLAAYDNGSGGGINNNSLFLSNFAGSTTTGRLTLTTPGQFQVINILASSGNGASSYTATLHFTDNSTTVVSGLSTPDWFNGPLPALQAGTRMTRQDGIPANNSPNPQMYSQEIFLSAADQAKTLNWIDFTYTNAASSTSTLNLFGLSGVPAGGVAPSYPNAVTVTANSTLQMLNTPSLTFGGTLTIGGNTLTTNTGTLSATSLTFPSTTLTGNPTFSIATGQTFNPGTINFNSAARTITVTGGGTTNFGSAAANLTATNTLTVNGGTANVTAANAVGTTNLTVGGGTANMGPYTSLNNLTVSSGTANLPNVATLTGTATISGGTTNVTPTLTAPTLSMTGGTVNLTGGASITTGTVNSGTINSNAAGANLSFNRLNGAGGTISMGGNALTIGSGNANDSFGGLITGSGAVVNKVGTGTQVLTSSGSTYTGGTNLTAGRITAANPGALGTGTVTLSNGTTLAIGGIAGSTITGFGGNGTGWQLNGGPTVAGDVVTLTTATNGLTRSLWFNNGGFNLANFGTGNGAFSASFKYSDVTGGGADGATFAIHGNTAVGPAAIGGGGGSLGYAGGNVNPSVALQINIFANNTPGIAVRINGNGAPGGAGSYDTTGSIVTNVSGPGNEILFNVTYDGANNYTVQMTQGSNTFSKTYNPFPSGNLASNLGSTVWVGFTGATGGANAQQSISNFTFNWAGDPNVYPPLSTYANAVALPAGVAATLSPIVQTGVTTFTMGGLSMGSGAALTVQPDATSLANTGYNLTLGATTLAGPATFAVANNGTGTGQLTLGALNDGGTARTVTKTGNGTLTLGAATSLVDGTQVNVTGGTLRVTNPTALGTLAKVDLAASTALSLGAAQTVAALTGTGGVALNGNALTVGSTNNLSATFGGVIADGSGPGALVKAGTGTLTLTAANTYTNGTTVSAGTLQVGNGGTTGSIVGNVTDNAALVFNRSDAITFPGVISGTGTLTQNGANTLTLTGNNTYSGTTTIAAGTVQVGAGGTTGSLGTGDTTNNGALVFNRSNAYTYGGAISGTGSVTQSGGGTTTLTGNSTYTGGTTIAGGTLQVGNGGTTGSITGNVTNNAALAFNRSDTATFAGVISGTGSVTQAGTGTTVLTAANTYTGGTTIAAGTLQLGNGGTTGSISGNVTNNGTLAFNRSDAVTFGGVISGTGGVTQAGTGTTTLTGANTYTGPTAVTGGTLLVNGSLANTALTVGSGATLGGTGSTGGSVLLQAGATLSPGASVGTFSAAGPVTITGGTGSTWLVEFNGAGSTFPPPANTPNDRLAVTGTGNNLNLVAGPSNKLTIAIRVADGFNPGLGTPMSFTIATTDPSGAIQSNGAAFTFDPNAYTFQPVNFFAQDFSLGTSGNQLVLTFTPVPEPGTVLAMSAAALGLMTWTRRRLRQTTAA